MRCSRATSTSTACAPGSASAAGLAFLGVEIDPASNDAGAQDISAAGSVARTLVVDAREDVEIARGVRAALG